MKWIQKATAEGWPELNHPILQRLNPASSIDWRSPRADDGFAEYRDAAFLEVLGIGHLAGALCDFWPNRGPQWDALGVTDTGKVLIVEAKAHVGELCSSPTAAGSVSRARITARLEEIAARLGSSQNHISWADVFYQLANRIAHLAFLRDQNVPAFLVLVNFLNDHEMSGPTSPEVWRAAYQVAHHAMGLSRRHALSRFIIEVYPDVGKYSRNLSPNEAAEPT